VKARGTGCLRRDRPGSLRCPCDVVAVHEKLRQGEAGDDIGPTGSGLPPPPSNTPQAGAADTGYRGAATATSTTPCTSPRSAKSANQLSGPRLLRAQTRRGRNQQRGPTRSEAADLQHRLPATARRQPPM